MSKAKPSPVLNALLSKADILKAKVAFEYVDVPEWGGKVLVQEMTGAQRAAWEELNIKERGTLAHYYARLVAISVVDEDGNRLFDDSDVPVLLTLHGSAINKVAGVAFRLSKLGADDVKEAEKN
jgi:hypothetical protein